MCKKGERGKKCSLNYGVIILLGLVFSGVMVGAFAIINCCVSKGQKTMWLDGGAWVELVVGSLGAVTTAILGYVAVWQNGKQREDYKKAEQRMTEEFNKNNDSIVINRFLESESKYLESLNKLQREINEEHKLIIGPIIDIIKRINDLMSSKQLTENTLAIVYRDFIVEYTFFQSIFNKIYLNTFCLEEKKRVVERLSRVDRFFKDYTENVFMLPKNNVNFVECLKQGVVRQNKVFNLFQKELSEFKGEFVDYVAAIQKNYFELLISDIELPKLKQKILEQTIQNEVIHVDNYKNTSIDDELKENTNE